MLFSCGRSSESWSYNHITRYCEENGLPINQTLLSMYVDDYICEYELIREHDYYYICKYKYNTFYTYNWYLNKADCIEYEN